MTKASDALAERDLPAYRTVDAPFGRTATVPVSAEECRPTVSARYAEMMAEIAANDELLAAFTRGFGPMAEWFLKHPGKDDGVPPLESFGIDPHKLLVGAARIMAKQTIDAEATVALLSSQLEEARAEIERLKIPLRWINPTDEQIAGMSIITARQMIEVIRDKAVAALAQKTGNKTAGAGIDEVERPLTDAEAAQVEAVNGMRARIPALIARVAELKEALKPFAAAADIKLCGEWRDDERFGQTDASFHLTFGDLRKARTALTKKDETK